MKHSVEEVVLDNGAKGLLIHAPSSTAMNIEIQFRAGDRYILGSEKPETAHLMEHMVLGANQKFTNGRVFNAELEKNGAYANAHTGQIDLSYELECADFEWERVFDLLELAITEPIFPRREFNAEIGNVREEFNRRVNNHNIVLFSELGKKMGDTMATDRERLEMIDNVKLADVVEHYERTHTTDNMRFVIGGNLTPTRRKRLLAKLEKFKLPRGERFDLIEDVTTSAQTPLYVRRENVDNLIYGIVYAMPRQMTDKEADAMRLINHMLTGTLHSLVLGEAREKGLTYGMGSGYNFSEKSSEWYFTGQVSSENASALFDILLRELRKINRGRIQDDVFDAAKQFALGSFQRNFQTIGSLVGRYGARYYFDEKIVSMRTVPRNIKAVSKEQVIELVRAILSANIFGFGVLSNVGRDEVGILNDQLQQLWK